MYIYPLIYTPLPNFRWLYNIAVRYVRSVKLGAYMWENWAHLVKKGFQWACFKAFGTLEGPKTAQIRLKMGSFYLLVHPD